MAAVPLTPRAGVRSRPHLHQDRPSGLVGLAVAIALNGGAIVALLHYEPARDARAGMAPIMVNLITPPRLEAPPAPPAAPESNPIPKARVRPVPKPIKAPPIIAAAAQSESISLAPPAPKAPPEPVAAPRPEPAPDLPAPIVPPHFNANYLHNPAPPYPPLARRMGEQGRVVLRVLVRADGQADRVELRASSGSPRLDESALETVRRWKFVPARQGEQPVAAWVLVPISFTLQG